jgi:hypothetical protein
MRSEYRLWSDPFTVQWVTSGGATARVVYPAFGGDRVLHDDGSWAPKEFTYVEMPEDASRPYYVVECEYGDADLKPRIIAVHTIQRSPERDVRVSDLRQISLEDALEDAWVHVVQGGVTIPEDGKVSVQQLTDSLPRGVSRSTFRGLRAGTRSRVTDERLQLVADTYRAAQGEGAPTKAVGRTLDVAPSTASLWVKRARDAGLLEPPPARRKKGGESRE